jgi:hypothetical protein
MFMAVVLVLGQATTLPPAYPRAGTTRLLDNSRVQVWDISWLKQQYPLHRHRYDLIGVYYTDGDRIIVSSEGERRPVSTKAWETAFQLRGVTHVEEGASDVPLRAVFVEMKDDKPLGKMASAGKAPAFPNGGGEQLRDNERAIAWEFVPAPGAPAAVHRHLRDAVAVTFSAGKPRVTWVPSGTEHESEGGTPAERLYVFELK